jgi:hypothetical protein
MERLVYHSWGGDRHDDVNRAVRQGDRLHRAGES